MTTSILTTKLFIPQLPSNLLSRYRLIEKLNQSIQYKLTLISAPAGYGKTTLLSDYIRECGLSVAWLSLDEGDDDIKRFLLYVISALQTINPKFGMSNVSLLDSPQQISIESILTDLINELSKTMENFILVLDDYHLIESNEIDETLLFIIDHLPHQMRLVISSRTDPSLPLPRLRARGHMAEIREKELRFNLEEVGTFLESSMGINISANNVATLESHTEGWITGLQLAAISMQGLDNPEEISRFVGNFSSSHRFILDYLIDEVLQQRPEGTREFLLQTSILDRLSDALCNAVTGRDNCQEILETLESANLFIIPLDNERVWYRYHHLFGELLQFRLQRATPQLIPELHRRASAWYAENDAMSEAIAHSLAAEDFKQAAQLTEQTFFDRMSRGEDLSMMLARLVAIPDNIIRAHPRLGVMFAWMLSLTLKLDEVEPRLVDVETRFADQLPEDLKRQIAFIRVEVLRHQGDFLKTIAGSLQILETLPEEMSFTDQQTYTGLVSNLAWGYLLAGDVNMAQKWFRESIAIGQHSITLTLLGLFGLALTWELKGQLQQAFETCYYGFQLVEETPQKIGGEVPARVYMHLKLGNLLREQDQLKEAERHLTRGLELGQKWNYIGDTMRDGYLDLSKLRLAQGDFPGALDVLHQAEQLIPYYRSIQSFGDTIEAHKARVNLAWATASGNSGHLNPVTNWVDKRDFLVSRSTESINEEFEYLVWVRLLIAQNQSEKAIRALEGLIESATENGRFGRVIEMKILQSLAHQALGDFMKALTALGSALFMAEPEGYVRLFVDEGPPMKELLQKAIAGGVAVDYVSRLLSRFDWEREHTDTIKDPQQSTLIEPLSRRELEVLGLLAEGSTNQEIAEKLVIAVTTAKKHVSNILGKLGVTNRTQAVTRARELKLL